MKINGIEFRSATLHSAASEAFPVARYGDDAQARGTATLIIAARGDGSTASQKTGLAKKAGITAEQIKTWCREAGVDYEDGDEDRVVIFRATDESVDRHGDIVRADGCDASQFAKNPVVPLFHNYDDLPVGSCIRWWLEGTEKAWYVAIKFSRHTQVAEEVLQMVRSGELRAVSIGFIPKEWITVNDEEERRKLGLGKWGYVISKWEWIEVSVVLIGSNRNALAQNLAKGLKSSTALTAAARALLKGGNDGLEAEIRSTLESLVRGSASPPQQAAPDMTKVLHALEENTKAVNLQILQMDKLHAALHSLAESSDLLAKAIRSDILSREKPDHDAVDELAEPPSSADSPSHTDERSMAERLTSRVLASIS